MATASDPVVIVSAARRRCRAFHGRSLSPGSLCRKWCDRRQARLRRSHFGGAKLSPSPSSASHCAYRPTHRKFDFHDLELAVSRPRPPQHPLRLGDGRRHLPHRADRRRHGRRARRLHRAAAEGVRLEHRGDFLGAVDPLHPVRIDGAVRRGPVEPLRAAQRHAGVVAGGGLRARRVAVHDASLAAGAAVGRGDRPWHRHDRAGARRHHRRALVRGAPWPRGRHPHRQRGDGTTGIPAAAGEPHRKPRLAAGAGADLRDARRRRARGAAGDA